MYTEDTEIYQLDTAALLVTDKFPNQKNDGSAEAKYNTIQDILDLMPAKLPYKVYTAQVSQTGGATIATTQLKNTIGDGSGNGSTDLKVTDVTGALEIQMSTGAPLTSNKVAVFVGGIQGADGFPYITSVTISNQNIIYIAIMKYDGTDTSTPVFNDLSIEIRVYP